MRPTTCTDCGSEPVFGPGETFDGPTTYCRSCHVKAGYRDTPEPEAALAALRAVVQRAIPDAPWVMEYVREHLGEAWALELARP